MQDTPSVPQFPVHDFLQVAALNGTDHCLILAGERASGRIELRRGQVVHAEYGDLIGEEAVYSALTDPALAELGEELKRGPSRLMVVGHADARGATKDNLDLAARRACDVADYLKKQGVDEHRILVQSQAAGAPVESNQSEEGRAKNRRVDTHVIERT